MRRAGYSGDTHTELRGKRLATVPWMVRVFSTAGCVAVGPRPRPLRSAFSIGTDLAVATAGIERSFGASCRVCK
jgi:hypothetical protein